MSKSRPSVSARISAFARAYHLQHDRPTIFSDPLAIKLFSQQELGDFEVNLAKSLTFFDAEAAAAKPDAESALRFVMRNHVAPITLARSRYAEDTLEEAVNAGTRQYVLLGAGFDTFAFRRPDLAAKLQVYELDDASTQEEKKQRIANAGWTIPDNLHLVPINFISGDLDEALSSAGFDPRLPSFFSLLGVSYY